MGGGALRQPRPVLLDTCAAIWLAGGDPMSAESRAVIAAARSANEGVFISPITAWEIALLVSRSRIRLTLSPEDWVEALLGLPGIRLAPLSPNLLIASSFLPGTPPRDLADRIIAATARAFGQVLVTRDGELIPYARAGHLSAVNC